MAVRKTASKRVKKVAEPAPPTPESSALRLRIQTARRAIAENKPLIDPEENISPLQEWEIIPGLNLLYHGTLSPLEQHSSFGYTTLTVIKVKKSSVDLNLGKSKETVNFSMSDVLRRSIRDTPAVRKIIKSKNGRIND